MSVVITILWIFFWIWVVLSVNCFAQLMHEGLTNKDPKAFVREWTDFLGIFIYVVMAILLPPIMFIMGITQPKQLWVELTETFDYWKRGGAWWSR